MRGISILNIPSFVQRSSLYDDEDDDHHGGDDNDHDGGDDGDHSGDNDGKETCFPICSLLAQCLFPLPSCALNI